MDENDDKNLFPDLKDVLQAITRYNTLHKEGCFVFNFVGWKKDPENICECGECCETYDKNKSMVGLHGDLETIRTMLEEMRDIAEDFADEDGFVSV